MKKTSKLKRWLFPVFGLRSDEVEHPYSQEWDELLNLLLDEGEVERITEFRLTFKGGWEVWIENHPFASGCLMRCPSKEFIRFKHSFSPSMKTVWRLEDFVNSLHDDEIDPMTGEMQEKIKELKVGRRPSNFGMRCG